MTDLACVEAELTRAIDTLRRRQAALTQLERIKLHTLVSNLRAVSAATTRLEKAEAECRAAIQLA